MKTDHADITVVLARSGSMAAIANDTIGGFNRFLEDQKKVPGSCTFTLHQFDHEFETVIDSKPIASAEPLTGKTFVPRGNTALLDAVGRAIKDTGLRLEKAKDHDRAGKVIFVVITDGHENASHEFTHAVVKGMIDHQTSKYSWQFVYLGATADAFDVGTGMGFVASNVMRSVANAVGTHAMYSSVSDNTTAYRVGAVASMAFTDEDKKKQADAEAKK